MDNKGRQRPANNITEIITVLFIIKINLLVSVILFFTKEIYRKKMYRGKKKKKRRR